MLLGRKFCLVLVAILYSGNPMFQASLALSVMIIAYGLHVKFLPFLEPGTGDAGEAPSRAAAALQRVGSPGLRRAGAITMRRVSMVDIAKLAGAGLVSETRRQIFHLNVLESTMLRSSIAVLLCGMIFQSGEVLETGPWYTVLAALVGTILVGSTGLFVGLVAVETAKVCTAAGKLAGIQRMLRRRPLMRAPVPDEASIAAKVLADLAAKSWTANPLRRRMGMLGALTGPSGETLNPVRRPHDGDADAAAAAGAADVQQLRAQVERLTAEVARLMRGPEGGAPLID